jgi:colanic acid/amylovoran biosynthesis glycosyltransferase
MLTLIHNNPVRLDGGVLRVDRKFHDGMLNYVRHIHGGADGTIVTVHPLPLEGDRVMDPVEIPLKDLPYRVLGLTMDRRNVLEPQDALKLDAQVAQSRVVVGYGYGTERMAHRHGKRLISCLEYDLQTQLVVIRAGARDPARAAVGMLRCLREYRQSMVPAMRQAYEVHCNGYPIEKVAAAYNPKRLLYFDSRMSADMVISEQALAARLAAHASDTARLAAHASDTARPLKLLYSGRYEPMKGALDAVKAAAECLRRGLKVEMDCYGQGSLFGAMRAVAAAAGPAIRVFDAIPFPELVQKSHAADVFICCHIQSDPSCTYLESMGAGLPIVGYANRMWTSMAEASKAGVVTASNTPQAVADAIASLLASSGRLAELSHNARHFAAAHAFELEFARRTDAINAALGA